MIRGRQYQQDAVAAVLNCRCIPLAVDTFDRVNAAWERMVAYKASKEYDRRVTAATAQRAALRSPWSAL